MALLNSKGVSLIEAMLAVGITAMMIGLYLQGSATSTQGIDRSYKTWRAYLYARNITGTIKSFDLASMRSWLDSAGYNPGVDIEINTIASGSPNEWMKNLMPTDMTGATYSIELVDPFNNTLTTLPAPSSIIGRELLNHKLIIDMSFTIETNNNQQKSDTWNEEVLLE